MAADQVAVQPEIQIVSWNLTRRCNLACEHCYLEASPFRRQPDELSTAECLAVVDQLATASPGTLLILSGGEPLLRADLFEIAGRASSRGLAVVLGTNGTLLTRKACLQLKAAGVRGVGVSIDSLDAGRHDAFRRLPGSWRRAVRALEVLTEASLPFVVQTTVTRENCGEIPAIVDLALQKGARALNLYFLVPTGRGRYVSSISRDQYVTVLETVADLQERHHGVLMISAKCAPQLQRLLLDRGTVAPGLRGYRGAGGCPAAVQYCAISPTGYVTPCPYLPLAAGNVRERPLAEIWRSSPLFQRLRRRGDLTGRCGSCDDREACGGCRARAFAASGCPLAEDPLCPFPARVRRRRRISTPGEPAVYGLPVTPALPWTPDARRRMERIPAVLRGLVTGRVEAFARAAGRSEVTAELLREIRSRMAGGRDGDDDAATL